MRILFEMITFKRSLIFVSRGGGGSGVLTPLFLDLPLFICDPPSFFFLKYMLVHSLASKYARFVVLGRLRYWTPPPIRTLDPPILKSDDLSLGNQEILDPPFKNAAHAPVTATKSCTRCRYNHRFFQS